jgi:hypothetical protein
MGGGPSAAERRAQQEAEARARQQQQLQQQFMAAANVPDPLEEALRARDLGWLQWESGANGPLDVSKAPLGAALGLYDRAVNRQRGERHGIGALRMGVNASNPLLAQLLNQQSKEREQQAAAGDLERAVAMRSAEVNRSALPIAGLAQNRTLGLASLASGNANTAQGQYLQFLSRPRQPSFWQQLLLQGVGAAGQVGQGMASGGTGFFAP